MGEYMSIHASQPKKTDEAGKPAKSASGVGRLGEYMSIRAPAAREQGAAPAAREQGAAARMGEYMSIRGAHSKQVGEPSLPGSVDD
jgi:hypothetical protein